ncbi:MAG: Co2+/Mg2+ efflux protein ApaG [Aquabacterium sp.]|jgi:ApaG protein|uniref:Co2+/Mg2+ efflux protein ApaG n=1 Tax=Aquabacterium sp. TaxID=1872578 RepID=UPI001B42F2B3|nr:Co2+/Mg2+ efflux protein ApaG [Aquabacterium sp.]MBP7132232.1 Co2+/Mg2+ efflux protein ApaG [Aquabacterium sp.]MBP9063104.1 Co2+/Mg2+ efflux protein ApaG [Aquabacterium sp.]MDQ5925164.1 ApaG protein [Pseudomonadota bacterium]
MSQAQFTCAVIPQYQEDQSNPVRHEYTFAYTVTIVNSGEVPAQLIGRHWVITDATGRTEEVRGLGVVGQQPLLKPGERFEYTSWTRLDTPHGLMQGTYFCMTDAAEAFEVPIPAFTLARQQSLH